MPPCLDSGWKAEVAGGLDGEQQANSSAAQLAYSKECQASAAARNGSQASSIRFLITLVRAGQCSHARAEQDLEDLLKATEVTQ